MSTNSSTMFIGMDAHKKAILDYENRVDGPIRADKVLP